MTDAIVLSCEFCDLRLELDPHSGAPQRIWSGAEGSPWVPLEVDVEIIDGGQEQRSPTGGLRYPGALAVPLAAAGAGHVRSRVSADSRTFVVDARTTRPDLWSLQWRYRLRASRPRLSVDVLVRAESSAALARNVRIQFGARLGDLGSWSLHAPGNPVRPGVTMDLLDSPLGVSPAGGLAGSLGLLLFESTDQQVTLVVWPFSQDAIGEIAVRARDDCAVIDWLTDIAGQPGAGQALACSSLYLDLVAEPSSDVLAGAPDLLTRHGLTGPEDPPAWALAANIYEVQIGFSVFAGGYRYEPYPRPEALLADLDRIQGLGFDTIQIMPQQPYPSYNVHDLVDVTTGYGDEAVIRRIVDACHARGMHVILDILLHGVVDGNAVRQATAAIRSGPYAARLAEQAAAGPMTPVANAATAGADPAAAGVGPAAAGTDPAEAASVLAEPALVGFPSDLDGYLLAWSRHLLDFEPHWLAGAPERHRMLDEHPDWFCRDSAGRVIGIYTQSFDLAHPAFQRYFIDCALALVRRLDVDGFRFDAPTYNYFHNWSPRTRTDAAVSMLGCLSLFEDLRRELHALKPGALMYTEPSGALLRRSMDMNYNYDEHWLIPAVMTGGGGFGVRHAGDLRDWLAERNACLPPGSLTAHHIDSHDTFWWPLPGSKWRREQFGVEATAAWLAVFALSGGPYMTFVGGEVGIEEQVRRVNRLRTRPEFAHGRADFHAATISNQDVYAVVREAPDAASLLVVNLSSQPVSTGCAIDGRIPPAGGSTAITVDLLGGESRAWIQAPGREVEPRWQARIALAPFQAAALALTEAT